MKHRMTAEEYKVKTGYLPIDDDLERVHCPKAGEAGHRSCGWCETHDRPRFTCGCFLPYSEATLSERVKELELNARLYYRLRDGSGKSLFSPWWSKDFDDRKQALEYYVKFLLEGSPLAEVKLLVASELPPQAASNVFPPSEANILEVTQVHILERSSFEGVCPVRTIVYT